MESVAVKYKANVSKCTCNPEEDFHLWRLSVGAAHERRVLSGALNNEEVERCLNNRATAIAIAAFVYNPLRVLLYLIFTEKGGISSGPSMQMKQESLNMVCS